MTALFPFILAAVASDPDTFPHPALPPPANWPGVMVIIIVIGVFGTAMVLGPVVRALSREDEDECSRQNPEEIKIPPETEE